MEYMESHGNFNRAQSSAVALSLSLSLSRSGRSAYMDAAAGFKDAQFKLH